MEKSCFLKKDEIIAIDHNHRSSILVIKHTSMLGLSPTGVENVATP